MLIGIITALLALSTMFESPYLVGNSDQLIKKHVEDKSNKEELLNLLDEVKVERKSFVKKDKKLTKKFDKLTKSRESTMSDFNELIELSVSSRKQMQAANFNLSYESQFLISDSEWENIKPDLKKKMDHLLKLLSKGEKSVKKSFRSTESTINKIIVDKEKAAKVIESLHNLEVNLQQAIEKYKHVMSDENSVLYDLEIEKQQIKEVHTRYNQMMKKVFDSYVTLYFVSVESTTEKEWEKLKSRFKLPK